MVVSIGYVQAIVGQNTAETASGKQQTGSIKLDRAEKQRKDLQKSIETRQKEIDELQKKLMEQKDDASGFWGWCKSLVGDDSGVGETGDKISTEGAEMKKASRELEMVAGQIEAMLKELQAAQSDVTQRLNDRQKTYDENAHAQKSGM